MTDSGGYQIASLTQLRKVKEEGGELLMLGGGSDAKVHPDDDGIVKTYSLKEFWIKGHLDDSSPLLCRYL